MTTKVAVFGGGCFWCTEAVFKLMKGVSSVAPGYAGGHVKSPTYRQVCTGTTGHAEVIRIEYDPTIVEYRDLLTVFFGSHDATQVDGQGADIGPQYRSIIFTIDDDQKREAEAYIKELNASTKDGDPIATTVEPLKEFYPAEDYHHDYFENNPMQGYCRAVVAPKVQKARKNFAALLKDTAKFA
ncbi:MAG: peptide-methionine (S)-S-oxide reductase MsrA [Alphaproteobacteria bacterium]